MKYMKYLTIWMTYHDDQLLTEYNLKETDTISFGEVLRQYPKF